MKINFSQNDLMFLNFISKKIPTVLLQKNFKAKNSLKSYVSFYKLNIPDNNKIAIYNLKEFLNIYNKFPGKLEKKSNKLIIKYNYNTINYDLYFEDAVLLPADLNELLLDTENFFELKKDFLYELNQEIKLFNIEKIVFEKNKIKLYKDTQDKENPFIIKEIKLNLKNSYSILTEDFYLLPGDYIVKFSDEYLQFQSLTLENLYFFISTIYFGE